MQTVMRSTREFAGGPWETEDTRHECAGVGLKGLQARRAEMPCRT
jgi:hypothetical protein